MEIKTHRLINTRYCGAPVKVAEGVSRVELLTTADMAVDDRGLVHGGFIFGLADHAAMIAVNHPNVVLGASEVKFTKPVRVNETVIADARVTTAEGRKQIVSVSVSRGEELVFKGDFSCFVLDKHVLDDSR